MNYGLGLRGPSPADSRDFPVRAFLPTRARPLPEHYRLQHLPPVYRQGTTSMCMDFSLRTLKESQEFVERGLLQSMASGYLYGARDPEHWQDEGMYPREALSTLLKRGIPPAATFSVVGTYQACREAYLAHQVAADEAARPNRVKAYARCWSPQEVMAALVDLQSPVVIAIGATTKFMFWHGPGGEILPEDPAHFEPGHPDFAGGHALVIIGYRTVGDRVQYRIRNSWGDDWADQGECWLYADDPRIWELWVVTDVEPRGRRVTMQIGNSVLAITEVDEDGNTTQRTYVADVAPFIQQGRTFLPARAVAEALSGRVTWDEETQTVTLRVFELSEEPSESA